ncbi:MAG: HIT family protein [Actinomycetia bacterium]|jgi:diadenosine tetraphosphate (Ap4A) HIT family hydrolase|nr:HIT family protein [Actinomycetes bacterium]
MSTLFTKIINGDLPGRFVYRDDLCVAFLTIAPICPGHTLVVPRLEVDHWVDLPDELAGHLAIVARKIGAAQMTAFEAERISLIIAGLEVPHTHLHVLPITSEADIDFRKANSAVDPAELDQAAKALRAALGPDASA